MAHRKAGHVRFDMAAGVDSTSNGQEEEHYLGLPKSLKPRPGLPNLPSKEAHLDGPVAPSNENSDTKCKAAEPSQEDVPPKPPLELQFSPNFPVSRPLVAVFESMQKHLDRIGVILERQGPPAESLPDYQSRKFWDDLGGRRVSDQLFGFARGEHPELWYKFKRFETLSLLNLYQYQHELIELESRIYNPEQGGFPGTNDGTIVAEMRRLLREYYKAIASFREMSRMERPSGEERKATAATLATTLRQDHYTSAADAYAMMDLTPQALGVEADAIRVMTRAVTMRFSGNPSQISHTPTTWLHQGAHQTSIAPREDRSKFFWSILGRIKFWRKDEEQGIKDDETMDELGPVFQERKPRQDKGGIKIEFAGRPYQLPISRGVDTAARVIVSIIAGIFLLAPMFALSYMNNKICRLVTTSLFTLFFSVSLSVMSSAKNQELMAATAAYTAVLVVFLGQTS